MHKPLTSEADMRRVAYKMGNDVHHVLSDLFFNHDHKFKQLGNENEDAVYMAAQEFIDSYSGILSCELPSAKELTEDYFERL